jgi:cation transport ATPase
MRHQPYEKWILEDEELDPVEQKELRSHLETCHTCDSFAKAHTRVGHILSRVESMPAPSGFTARWTNSLAARKREQEQKQARAMLISFASLAIGILLAAGILLLPEFSLIALTARTLTVGVNVLNGLQGFWSTLTHLVRSVPPGMVIFASVFISSWIIFACVLWGVSIWKLAFRRGKVK